MKYLIILLIIFSKQLYAQSGVKRVSLPAGNFIGAQAVGKISGIKVEMADSLTLGYVPAKEGNETYKLVPGGQGSRWLDSLIKKRYAGQFARGGKELLWVVNGLSFSTDTAGQYYFGKLKAAVYVKNRSGAYEDMISVDTMLISPLVGEDAFGAGVIALLDGLYQSCLTTQVSTMSKKRTTWTELPVLKNEVNKGVYTTYEAFRNNKPSATGAFWAEADTTLSCGHMKLFTMTEDSTIDQLTDIWGVSFGGSELYKYEKGLLIPIEKSGGGFVLSRYKEPAERRNQALLWRRVAAYSWPADTNPYSRDKTLTVKMNTGIPTLPVAARIDADSGELTF